ncbi:MAG TPA: hypothetical protein VMF51_14150 [Nocardioides sp.]|nr:hypothetical protein [Nocardioides sp.]HTW16272.1 hypothetical protein [Nocardioides sp.]
MDHPVRRFVGTVPGLLALAVYLVLIAAPTTPEVTTGRVDTGLTTHEGR